jgi:hypothetical protein
MAQDINRQQFVEVLERLGGEDDADVLAAAREAHAIVNGAGMTWHTVLVPESIDEPEIPDEIDDPDELYDDDVDDIDEDVDDTADDTGDDADVTDDDGEDVTDSTKSSRDDSESLKLIERMMTHAKDNEDFREELNGYKEDIAEGEFTDRDRKYLRDLHARLRAS